MGLALLLCLAFLPCLALAQQNAAPSSATLFDRLTYQPSLKAGERDPNGKLITGTEIMNIVPFQGRLYASNDLWMERDPNVPKGCQVLVLDSPKGKWKVDHQFAKNNLRLVSLKSVTFTTDDRGKGITPVSMLMAAPDVAIGGTVEIFSLYDETAPWTSMPLGTATVYSTTRAIGFHHDAVTGVDLVFAGNDTLGTLRGVYDPRAPGRIRWDKTPEFPVPPDERVMGFCNCNGVCYCATTKCIFRRTDGKFPSWQQVYSCPKEKKAVGIRGLTAIPNPSGEGESLLFAALRKVRRLDVNGFKETIELDMPAFLTEQRGSDVAFALAAYNEFLPYTLPGTGETVWLFGFESSYPPRALRTPKAADLRLFVREDVIPNWHFDARAFYFIRRVNHGTVTYTTEEVTDPLNPTLVSVRAIAVSPFPEDKGKAFYFCGFDCNSIPSHNTAWIYRATIAGD